MNSYEATFIFKPDIKKDDLEKMVAQVHELIQKHKGAVGEIKDWGKKRMAYSIRKYKEGFYYFIDFHIGPEAIVKMRRAFSLNEAILRVLIVKQG